MSAICLRGYKAINILRPNRIVGGIAIIHQKELNVSHVKAYKFDTIECANFKISATTEADKHLTLIYQLPDINVLGFISDLSNILEEQITTSRESVILGDFNIRTNVKKSDTINLLDFIENFDLTNLVEKATHRLQNTTDLIVVPKLTNIIMDV